MTTDPQARPLVHLLTASISHLEWLATIPHTLDDCLRIQANETERDRDASKGLGSGGSSHADPTASGLRPVAEGDPEAASVDVVTDRMHAASRDLDHAVAEGMGRRHRNPPPPHGRQDRISQTIAALHSSGDGLEAVHAGSSPDWAAYLVMLLRSIHDDAEWLHSKGEGIYQTARLESRVRAEQKPLKGCQSCARQKDHKGEAWFVPVAEGRFAHYCLWCGLYRADHKQADPPLACVEYMFRHGKFPNSRFVEDAERASKPKGNRAKVGA